MTLRAKKGKRKKSELDGIRKINKDYATIERSLKKEYHNRQFQNPAP